MSHPRARNSGVLLCSLVAILACALTVGAALAAWPPGDVDVCLTAGVQRHVDVVPDGFGGVIVGWFDDSYGLVYVQRYDADGNALWTANGVVLPEASGASTGYMPNAFLVPDGKGGVLYAWYFNYGGAKEIRANRVDASGNGAWLDPVWGTPVSTVVVSGTATASSSELVQYTTDGAGGLIVAWHDTRGGRSIYAQRVDSTGAVVWTSGGVNLFTSSFPMAHPWIAPDGAGGAFVAWDAKLAGWTDPEDVYMQRVDASGNALWAANGVAVTGAPSRAYTFPRVESDGAGGAYVAYRVADNAFPYGWGTGVLRMLGDGTPAWPTEYLNPGTTGHPQSIYFDMTRTPDGGVLWAEAPPRANNSSEIDLFAFRLDSSGSGAWNGADVVTVSARDGLTENRPRVAVDSSGVTHVLFNRNATASADSLFVCQIDASGALIDSAQVDSGGYPYPERAAVTAVVHGAVFAWVDKRNGENDVFARMYASTVTGVAATPAPRARLGANWPNPFTATTHFDYVLDAAGPVELAVYDVAGRRVRTLATGRRGAGTHRAAWDGTDDHGRAVASGVYFVRLRARGQAVARRMTVLR